MMSDIKNSLNFVRKGDYIVPTLKEARNGKKPDWFVVLIYVCSVLIFGGVLVFIMYARATGRI